MSKTPHSAAVLTDLRDRWWSSDFLALLVSRLGLSACESVADLGCGHGHWGQRLLRHLAETTTLIGVDQEDRWVERATERAAELGLGARCHYQRGSIERLPFEDGRFDLVTCQTLLMHVANLRQALHEMLRILKPGGRLLLIEPNNVAQQFLADSVHRALSPQEIGALMTLLTACSRGRDSLGRGDDCVGDRLPVLLSEIGLEGLEVVQNERVEPIFPPYDKGDRALLDETIGHARDGFWLWNQDDARALFEAGGGDPNSFDSCYAVFRKQTRIFETQVESGSYWCSNASLSYIVSAIRPLAS